MLFAGHTTLHVACQEGHFDIVKILVEIGNADLHKKTKAGSSALDFAARNAHTDIVVYIAEKLE